MTPGGIFNGFQGAPVQLVHRLTAPGKSRPLGRRRISRVPCVSSIEGRRYAGGELVNDYRSESLPDHRLGTAHSFRPSIMLAALISRLV